MDRLIVKNFGPLKDVDIELNRINLFIGENGSGKSVLAKLVTILLDFTYASEKEILEKIQDYNINFLTKKTIIIFSDKKDKVFEIKNKKIVINQKLKKINNEINDLYPLLQKTLIKNYSKNLSKNQINNLLKEISGDFTTAKYIPAERSFVALISKSLSSFIVADIPLPRFFLQFSSEFEKAGNDLKELEFLNVKYVNGEGLDRHKVYFNDKEYLLLNESSSGIQSALPLYLTVKYFAKKHQSIIIEEPEQNLFPKAQKETIQYIVEQISEENNLFLMTHSPYVLSTLNNLIFAYKVAQMSKGTEEKVKEFVKEEQWINPDNFSAYYLENGIAKNIVSKRGLISDNEIDDISEDIAGEFDSLMEIYREFKYAK